MGFGNLELITLQQYWWIIISLLGGLFVFIMFVQGGQTLMDNHKEFSSSTKEIRNTFELVFKDGIWWVFEYDEEGRVINTYPLDE